MARAATLALLTLLTASVTAQDCEDLGGQCLDWEDYICHAGWETGLCPGDENIRCCLSCDAECQENEAEWSQDDDECLAMGGECFDNTNYCDGVYETGVCGGPDDRQCCRPLSEDCPAIISREEWGARDPTGVTYMPDGVPYLFIHHSAGEECFTQEECEAEVRAIQDYHMDYNGWSDIGYSFLIGGDGNVYEGRGWNVVGAHTYGFNSVGYGIDFIGTFTDHDPVEEAQDVYHLLAECAVAEGKVISSYELYGHRQTSNTECPGQHFYETIQSYPHWTSGCIESSGDCGDV